jgi:prevent-host-death family protein
MSEIGIKALKDHLSEYLRRAHEGERIVITDRGAPLALLVPLDVSPAVQYARELVDGGNASWEGGKPKGASKPAVIAGRSASQIVLEDRR